jgi:hypothetical protein
MNATRPLLLCTSARRHDPRRKPASLPACSVDCHHRARKRRWADAATSAQPIDTLPAHARARGVTLSKSSALLDDRNPRIVTAGYRSRSVPATPATSGQSAPPKLVRLAYHGACTALGAVLGGQARFLSVCLSLARPLYACLFLGRPRPSQPHSARDWLTRVLRWLGNLIFMAADEEAYWRGWTVERRHAGLSRRYRDPLFDTVARCPHCRGLGITVEDSLCVKCNGTGRITVDQPPFPCDG